MKRIGLTGSIGMGKSTTAAMFAARGMPVFDADAEVHRAYAPGGAAVEPLEAAFPGVTGPDGVDRAELSRRVLGQPDELKRLEAIVHPLMAQARADFIEAAHTAGAKAVLFDIPLLFETGGDRAMDATVVVSAPADVQRARVLLRPGMTAEKLDAILARQMPDAEKRARATHVIDTGSGLDAAREQVDAVLASILADVD
jgi:dephospho-CoA kinase